MQPAYIVQDQEGNTGQQVTITQGESDVVKVFMFAPSGAPLFTSLVGRTVSELELKIFSTINAASILKKFSLSQVTVIKDDTLGLFGFSFALASADSAAMAANNAGLPMSAILTLSDGTIEQFDFLAVFMILVGAVLT
jgi:hypothetical protein